MGVVLFWDCLLFDLVCSSGRPNSVHHCSHLRVARRDRREFQSLVVVEGKD
jgi:hypothetical protein